MNKLTLISTLAIALMAYTYTAKAQENLVPEGDGPVEISADNTLEWLQNEKQYVANGNVEIKQGATTIYADKVTADYKEGTEGGRTDIWRLTATDNVKITNADSTIIGNEAIYIVETGVATVTGDDLKLTMPDQTITASEKMEYDSKKFVARAIGNAKIMQEKNTLSANIITAHFTKDQNGKQVLKSAETDGGIKIVTPEETLTGKKGTYNAANNTAEVKGDVKIVRGPNQLEGGRAEVNLTTNISKMYGTPETGERVKGIFYPGSQPKDIN